jgi:hypothetical protein
MRWLWLPVVGLMTLAVLNADYRIAAAIAAIALVMLGLFRTVKRYQADDAKLFAAMANHVGRPHDVVWWTRFGGKAWMLAIWLAERKFYFSKVKKPFDANCFYGEQDIREWSIERSRSITNDRYWDAFAVNIAVKNLDNPLIKIHCGKDEATAYKINESFNQMFVRAT